MLLFFLPIIIMTSLLFMTMMHPLSTGLTLLGQTILVATASGLIAKSFWFSYILVLIFLGAMLVLFIYVASIASNEPLMFKLNHMMMFIIMSVLSLSMIFLDQLLFSNSISTMISSISTDQTLWQNNFNVAPMYNNTSFMFTIFIVVYLLLTLIIIVKIMSISSSPLRFSI